MTKKSLIIGAAFVDVIMNVPSMPASGGDVTADFKSNDVGGCAFNVYGAISYYLGKRSADLFIPVGEGQYARIVQKAMQERSIPILLQEKGKDNGWDLCLIEPSGERTFITVPGIEQCWQNKWFHQIDLADYDYFYLSGYEVEDPDAARVILDCLGQRSKGTYLLFDASPRISHISRNILSQILKADTIVNANEDEIGYLSDKDSLEEQAADIFSKTHSPVIITLGAKGSYVYDAQGGRLIPGEKVQVVNTIGAGDTHCGGVIAGLQEGMNIDEAVALGNKLSAKVIQLEAGSL
ncbi:bifunctional hydroxymethylpyrimidine kinase/phosphomethylpyrimidine kinase [Limosilactobacillus sp. STM2_1]|uniref:Bifunctional hydroxymethylpyrimidine kinase/phosphomethylpyrimidine kinase n=1 Tax=Limosilactobacillus rudii TaxID=2759755 RepID=A0A7W3UL95_9LACO|nr:PfkB family carbohydrate kinase [Limosilactobacillus rudii]MBB1078787.1 bifunctional hydroxymethylpyrimidine kinase/phosphomethylpyrimidine kinase [Limosilactobacillus rudii]MBB1097661.1 bifunctional hydroxymethylpyrimidine kinase/phosphomethylpyrimidine kinase [Limosilactobacillus rudii]MCD7134770.1 PfkB family carbohydrate kinase [Limosilactobacillus rudii]